MVAVWIAEADSAKADGSDPAGTTPGSSAATVGLSKVRAAPTSATAAKMPCAPSQPAALPTASPAAASASTAWQKRTVVRRS